MRHCPAHDGVGGSVGTELVCGMVDMFHHDEQIMEDRCEASIASMHYKWQVGLVAQWSEQSTHNALVGGSSPSEPK